jgi:hypothetical protein
MTDLYYLGTTYTIVNTGFLVNTSDNYAMDLQSMPYAITCRHHLQMADSLGIPIKSVLGSSSTHIYLKDQ